MAKKKDAGPKGKPPKAGKGAKAGKAKGAGGAKKSKIPRPVQGRGFAVFGLAALVPIAVLLLQGKLDLEAAAQRAVIVLVGLMLLERIVAPVVTAVLNSGRKPDPDPDEGAELTPAGS